MAHAQHTISLANGLLDIEGLLAGQANVLQPHTPKFFSTISLPFAWDPEADCPKWRAFLQEIMEDDPERIALWQAWCGYNLMPDVSYQKFQMGCGEGANGKQVCTDVLEALLGPDNVSHVPLEQFGQRFALWPTVGKLANIITEVGELARTDEGVFKQFVAGDPVSIDRKGLSILKNRPTARVTIMCNTRPRWLDRSEGIWRRLLYLPFRVVVPEERQDRTLAKRIIAEEMPGVFNWSVAGLFQLRKQGRFTVPAVSRDEVAEYRAESNPARVFLQSECRAEALGEVRSDWLYATYKRWCIDGNYRPLNDAHFGREVTRAYPKAERKQKSDAGRPQWYRFGIVCPLAENPANRWRQGNTEVSLAAGDGA